MNWRPHVRLYAAHMFGNSNTTINRKAFLKGKSLNRFGEAGARIWLGYGYGRGWGPIKCEFPLWTDRHIWLKTLPSPKLRVGTMITTLKQITLIEVNENKLSDFINWEINTFRTLSWYSVKYEDSLRRRNLQEQHWTKNKETHQSVCPQDMYPYQMYFQ